MWPRTDFSQAGFLDFVNVGDKFIVGCDFKCKRTTEVPHAFYGVEILPRKIPLFQFEVVVRELEEYSFEKFGREFLDFFECAFDGSVCDNAQKVPFIQECSEVVGHLRGKKCFAPPAKI